MKRRRVFAALALLSLAGCRGSRRPQAPKAAPVRTARSNVSTFDPPADGRLTNAQVEEFLRWLRASGRKGPAVFVSDPGDLEKMENSGQSQLGTSELAWVRGRVLTAMLDIESRETERKTLETYRRTLAGLRHALAASTDPAARQTLSGQIADIEAELSREEAAAARPLPPDAAANAALVSPRRKELQALSGLP